MSATSSPAWTADSEYACGMAAAIRGLGLIGVLTGFTRVVFGLGRVMSGVIARLNNEGADPYSANSGFDLSAAMQLLRRALHMADALRVRLLTPAVSAAMRRDTAARTNGSAGGAGPDQPPMPDDTMWRLTHTRADEELCLGWQQAIADMSDREVVTHIYTDLLRASQMLGETEVAARVQALASQAAALLDDETDAVIAESADHPLPDGNPDASAMPGIRPPVPAMERGPP